MLTDALAYAARGWPVFPCRPRAKEPLTAHGFHDASTDEAQVRAWWEEWPDANIGFVPGRAGIVVVDVDGPEGERQARALGLFAEPTLGVKTPRGWHLYYQHPGGRIGNRALAPGLDVRADDGYVLVPPSIHPTGDAYTIESFDVLALPPAARAKLNGNGNGHWVRKGGASELPALIPEGQRNSLLTSLAGSMRHRGCSEHTIFTALREENAQRCDPPLTEAELAAIAQSVARYAPAETAPALDADTAPAGGPDTTLTRCRSLAEVLEDPDAQKPPEPVIPNLAWAGRMTLVAANEGVGKSTLFAAAAAAVTTGGDFLGAPSLRGTVLWVLLEEHLSDLVIRALRFQTAPDAFQILERPDAPLTSLQSEVERLRPTVTIIDTLHQFAADAVEDASAAEQWAPTMTTLDRIARTTGTALLLSAKAARSTGKYRDSSEIGHAVDVVVNLVRPDKASPVRRLEVDKARWPLEDVTFQLVGDTYQRGGTVAKRLSPQRQKVLDALEPGLTFSEWQNAAEVPERTFTRAVKFLDDGHYVRHNADGTYEPA